MLHTLPRIPKGNTIQNIPNWQKHRASITIPVKIAVPETEVPPARLMNSACTQKKAIWLWQQAQITCPLHSMHHRCSPFKGRKSSNKLCFSLKYSSSCIEKNIKRGGKASKEFREDWKRLHSIRFR